MNTDRLLFFSLKDELQAGTAAGRRMQCRGQQQREAGNQNEATTRRAK